MRERFDWEGFKGEISGVQYEEGKEFVASRSKDYYWYSPILDEIFDPPIIQVIGFLISVVTFFKALISVSSCNPAKEGRNLVILLTEA